MSTGLSWIALAGWLVAPRPWLKSHIKRAFEIGVSKARSFYHASGAFSISGAGDSGVLAPDGAEGLVEVGPVAERAILVVRAEWSQCITELKGVLYARKRTRWGLISSARVHVRPCEAPLISMYLTFSIIFA